MGHQSRHAAAALLVATAAIHIDLIPEHLREAAYAGILCRPGMGGHLPLSESAAA